MVMVNTIDDDDCLIMKNNNNNYHYYKCLKINSSKLN
jgi:hypothetical protein